MQETIIVDNDFIMNQYGIILKYCYSNDQITKNLFYKNERYGIWTDSTDWRGPNRMNLNAFLENNGATELYDPDHVQAFDVSGFDLWNGTDDLGNYWSDWLSPDYNFNNVVDDPYPIGGGIANDNNPRNIFPFVILSRPLNLNITSGNGFVNLSWEEPDIDRHCEAHAYNIYRGTESGNEVFLVQTGKVLFHNDTTVENNEHYFYYVKAENIFTEGRSSIEVDAWTDGEPPSLSILKPRNEVIINFNEITVEW
ncbi:MAG: hypothetical protein KAH57_03425, partial [Thermoplasmata archaeon]|nr:hypothetical protein [Thermoplasmata archaeon]